MNYSVCQLRFQKKKKVTFKRKLTLFTVEDAAYCMSYIPFQLCMQSNSDPPITDIQVREAFYDTS